MDWFLYDNGLRHERVKLSWKYNKSAKQMHTSNYAPTRRLKRKQPKTDCNLDHNGSVNEALRKGQSLLKILVRNLENVIEPMNQVKTFRA